MILLTFDLNTEKIKTCSSINPYTEIKKLLLNYGFKSKGYSNYLFSNPAFNLDQEIAIRDSVVEEIKRLDNIDKYVSNLFVCIPNGLCEFTQYVNGTFNKLVEYL